MTCEDERRDHWYMTIPTLEGDHRATPGDWIIRGVKGEFYPCRDDIFAATYEPADEPLEERCWRCGGTGLVYPPMPLDGEPDCDTLITCPTCASPGKDGGAR